jgi:hypothetical protein
MLQEQIQPDIEAYVAKYVQAIGDFPFVERVLVDASEGLTIYTVYQGELSTIARRLFAGEAAVRRQIPGKRMRFETVPADAARDYFPA